LSYKIELVILVYIRNIERPNMGQYVIPLIPTTALHGTVRHSFNIFVM